MAATITKASARTYSRLGQSGALFGMGLLEAADEVGDVYLLTADMGKPAGMSRFKNRYPDRFINVGIAEQNLVGMAAGIASEGHMVVASAQAVFLSMRSFEQVRQFAGYMNLPLVLVGVAAGFGLTFFGNTHYAIEDLALMRTIPGMTVMSPSDAGQAAKSIVVALKSGQPTYIRCTAGLNAPVLYDTDYDLEPGRPIELKAGSDVAILATGAVVANALAAAFTLDELDVSTAVLDVHTVKPFAADCLDRYRDVRLLVSVEEHSVIGGLGGAIAEQLAAQTSHPPLLRLGVQDRFLAPGDYQYLIQQAGLDQSSIVERILSALQCSKGRPHLES
jgi:transketolase